MRDYELMVVLDPNLDDDTIDGFSQRLTTLVTQRGGSVESMEPWGRRRLAYPVGRFRDGVYLLSRFRMGPDVATDVERMLKLTESVIRHLLVRPQEAAPAAAHA